MSYIVKLFDGLLISPYIQGGDSQDIGSGSALTSFLPLPGGGYYDNYRNRKSPQGIRPIAKSGLFWGTDSELRAELEAWRAKLGQRGRLTVEFDDGSLRWQWARLQDVSAPRPSNAKGGWLPFTLTWITAAQNWRGYVHEDGIWAWGDGEWDFGDGSAAFGVGAETFDVTASGTLCTVSHGGTIDAPNVTLRFDLTGAWQVLIIVNHTTGQQIRVANAAPVSTAWLEIDAGARSIYSGAAVVNLTSAAREHEYTLNHSLLRLLTAAQAIATGDTVRVEGTDEYDGDYYPATSSGTADAYVYLPPRHPGYGTVTTGTVRSMTNIYDLAVFADRERWLVLAPGDNVIEVQWTDAPVSATMTVEYDDHYA